MCLSVGLVHYSRDLQTFYFNKTFIKNRSHGAIHTFKNYFATVLIGQKRIDPLWLINWLISQVY